MACEAERQAWEEQDALLQQRIAEQDAATSTRIAADEQVAQTEAKLAEDKAAQSDAVAAENDAKARTNEQVSVTSDAYVAWLTCVANDPGADPDMRTFSRVALDRIKSGELALAFEASRRITVGG